MESPIAIYQLIILYILQRCGGEIAMPHLSKFLLENGYVNFESLVSTYREAQTNGFVTTRVQGETTFVRITDEGRQTWKFFRSQLSEAIRQQADEYLQSIGRELVSDRSVIGEYYKASYGGYMAHMAVKEDKAVLLEINLNLPSEESARAVIRRWKEQSTSIYQDLIAKLLQ